MSVTPDGPGNVEPPMPPRPGPPSPPVYIPPIPDDPAIRGKQPDCAPGVVVRDSVQTGPGDGRSCTTCGGKVVLHEGQWLHGEY